MEFTGTVDRPATTEMRLVDIISGLSRLEVQIAKDYDTIRHMQVASQLSEGQGTLQDTRSGEERHEAVIPKRIAELRARRM